MRTTCLLWWWWCNQGPEAVLSNSSTYFFILLYCYTDCCPSQIYTVVQCPNPRNWTQPQACPERELPAFGLNQTRYRINIMLKDTGYRTKFQTFLLRTFTRSRLSLSGLAPKQDDKNRNIVEFTHLVSALGTEGL